MDHQGTVTLYRKTKVEINQGIQSLQTSFKNLGIHSINLGPGRQQAYKVFFEKDLEWLTLKNQAADYGLIEKVSPCFTAMKGWLDRWTEAETRQAGSNNNLLQEFDERLEKLKISLLAILLYHKDANLEVTISNADYVFRAYPQQNLEYLVVQGKKDLFRSRAFDREGTIDTQVFFRLLNEELVLFDTREKDIKGDYGTSEGINQIYLEEIKKHFNLGPMIHISEIDRIFSYIWGSFRNFRRFFNRNYLYQFVEKGLDRNGLSYSELQGQLNTGLSEMRLTLSHCRFQNLVGKSWIINHSGLKNGEVKNHLIIFGKDASEEFSASISLPNMNSLDSIFAFIYCTAYAYYLVDISTAGVIKIKVLEEKLELKDKMVIIFGNSHGFNVTLQDGIVSRGQQSFVLKLSGNEECKSTKSKNFSAEPVENFKYTVGSLPESWLCLAEPNINPNHAKIFFRQGKWYLKNIGSSETYYKLKRRGSEKDIEYTLKTTGLTIRMQHGPSDALELKRYMVFKVDDFTFILLDPEDE